VKVLFYSTHGFDNNFVEKANANKHQLVLSTLQLNLSTVNLAEGFDAISVFTSDIVSSDVLKKLKELGVKYIALRSVGHDHIDLHEAKKLGIKSANVPAYSPYAIAEHAVALLMALNRKLLLGQQLMQNGDYRLDHLIGFDLHGKTVGIVGTGKIGAAFARIMHGFGCKLLAYDIAENADLQKDITINYTSLEALCKQSDVISLCCPLNKETKYLFNATVFSTIKKGCVLINTARGGLINTKDLMDALDAGIISSAGLDVYENEKPIFFQNLIGKNIPDPLYKKLSAYQNVLITGHQAFLTNEALKGIADTTFNNINQWEENGCSDNDL
jgi:D-lactate dehydrogenase